MSINDHLLIEKYFQGVLTPEEKVLYEEKLAGDPVFRKEVEVHEQALQLIQEEGRRMLKERLAEKGKAIERKRSRRKWLGLLLLVFACLFIMKFSGILPSTGREATEEGLHPSDAPVTNPSMPISTDSLKHSDHERADHPSNHPETAPAPQKATKQNTDELFAAYYRPFEDEGLQSGLRGLEQPGPSDLFIEAYLKGHYTDALSLFEKMDSYDRQNDNMLFIKTLSLIGTGEYSRAIPVLELIIERDQSRYMDAAQWYLALTYLKTSHVEKAKDLLQHICQDPTGSFVQKANALIKKM